VLSLSLGLLTLIGCVAEAPFAEHPQAYVVEHEPVLVRGEVTRADGSPVAFAEVELAQGSERQRTTTDDTGRFSFEIERGSYRLEASAPGFRGTYWRSDLAADSRGEVSLRLAPVERIGHFDVSRGAVIVHEGSTLTLAPNAFVDARGERVQGDVEYYLSYVSPAVPDDLSSMPILDWELETLGVLDVEFYANGESVNLAPDSPAEIVFSLNGLPYDGDPTMEIFTFDSDRFSWVEVGVGTVEESPEGEPIVRARVSHFSAKAAGREKVDICHYPPGNPFNVQTIRTGRPALDAHLAHGDVLMPCDVFLRLVDECDGSTSIFVCTRPDDPDYCTRYASMMWNTRVWLADVREFMAEGAKSDVEPDLDFPICALGDDSCPFQPEDPTPDSGDNTGDSGDTGSDGGDGTADSGTSAAQTEADCNEWQVLINGVCYYLSDL
jgi:hypothetical protein